MKKILATFFVLLILSTKGQTQNIAPTVFLYENKSSISKDSILKMAKLNISDTSLIIESFTYVVTGNRIKGEPNPSFGINKGNKFCKDLIDELVKYKNNQSSLLITDVVIQHKKKDIGKTKRLNQHLTINF